MRRICSVITGVVFVLAAAFAGCGGDSGPAPGEGFLDGAGTSSVQFKSTDTNQFNPLINQMKENMKTGGYRKKQVAPKETAVEKK
jgi:hypothetical protein